MYLHTYNTMQNISQTCNISDEAYIVMVQRKAYTLYIKIVLATDTRSCKEWASNTQQFHKNSEKK